jgi:hypothetical protein
MYHRQQQPQGIYLPIPGFPSPGYPDYPGPGGGGNLERRFDRLERQVQRNTRSIEQLERRVERLERRIGGGYGSYPN